MDCNYQPKTVLSFGMGVESSALFVRWAEVAATRDFDLTEDLIVITAQTGDEYPDTKFLVERHILPRMRAHRIRYVQVARAGHLEADGIVVLSDTREPDEVLIDGAYKLSQELRAAGTVPQFSGEHRCSLKFKAWVIETWLRQEMNGEPYRHAFGYHAAEGKRIEKCECAFAAREPVRVAFGFNSEEGRRISKAQKFDTPWRQSSFPIADWGWDRDACSRYLKEVTGETWPKSACVYCPFNALKADGIARLRQFPNQVAEALSLEYQSLSLNPRGTLYRDKTFSAIVTEDGNLDALAQFERTLAASLWALYRVRRIYKGPGHADRAVEKIETGARATMQARFAEISSGLTVRIEHGISYGYVREREPDHYPTVEEFFVIAPAKVESKARYGFEWFEQRWQSVVGVTGQRSLFDNQAY